MMDDKVWCNNHAQYLEIVSLLSRLNYTWADDTPLHNYDPFQDAAIASDDFKCAICINRQDKTITVGFNDNNTISFTKFLRSWFTKADLEDGMVVRTREGNYYMYFESLNKIVRFESNISCFNATYSDDLYYASSGDDHRLNVDAVYKVKNLTSLDFAHQDPDNLVLVWERPKEVIMTITEIEEKLRIKHLKIIED